MAKILGNKSGAIVIETDKGLLQIYIKDGDSIVTLESSRNLVTYAKTFEMSNVISPFTSLVCNILPNNMALKLIGHEFGKRDNIVLEDNNEKLMLHNEGIKKGDKSVRYSTYNNIKVDNLFDEYDRNPNVFSGFCNYKIDSVGNIDDRELDLLKKMFTPKYTIKELIDGNAKTKEALTKESSTEKFLSKIYKEYSKEHDDELDDIQRIGFKKIKNLFSEVTDSLKDSNKEDMLDTLERARTTIVARNKSIPNILSYINDSRLEGNYEIDDVNKTLAMIYIKEKLHIFGKSSSYEEKFSQEEIDPKLEKILGEDIVRLYKKDERINYEDMLPIQFAKTRQKLMDVSSYEEEKVDGVLKRYVDLLECMNYKSDLDNKDIDRSSVDELSVIIKNYENYLEEGVLNSLGIVEGDDFITVFRNSIKNEIIKDKMENSEVITFSYRKEEEDNETTKEEEYVYVIKDGDINVFKDNMDCGVIDESETKEKYKTYIESQEVEKESLSKLCNKTHFIFVPEEEKITQIKPKYQIKNVVNDTIYMIKTVEEEKDIRRTSYLNEIKNNVESGIAQASDFDLEDIIYKSKPNDILDNIKNSVEKIVNDDVELINDVSISVDEEETEEKAAIIDEVEEEVLE